MLDGRRTLRGDLVSHLFRYSGFDGPDIPPSSLCGQPALLGGPLLALRTSFCQLPSPGVLWQAYKPIILETEPDQEFLGFRIEFEPFALRYSPPRDFNQVMSPFSASPLGVQLWALCPDCFWSPNVRTPNPNSYEVLPHCIACTKLQAFRNLTSCQLPNRSVDIYISTRFGKTSHQVAASEPSQTWNLEQLRSTLIICFLHCHYPSSLVIFSLVLIPDLGRHGYVFATRYYQYHSPS